MGSLFAALTTAVAGLDAQSSSIGNISDNLANAQTTGYKSVGTRFEELVTASNSVVNNPGGVSSAPRYQNDAQGSITSSNTTTNLAISGSGYFAVETGTASGAGSTIFSGTTLYTRQGDFTLDKNGYIVNGSGYYLTGYTVNSSTGSVDQSKTVPIQISALQNNPIPTTKINYAANLPSNSATGFTASTSTVQVYDAFGNTHSTVYTWSKTGTNAWSLNVSIPDAKDSNGNTFTANIPFTFQSSSTTTTAGTISAISAYTAGTASTPPSPYTAATTQTAGATADATISVTFPGGSAQSLELDFGTFNGSTGVTQFSDTNTAVTVSDFSQDGLPKGSFNSIEIDKDGFVSLNYSNGTNKKINQIPLALFYAEDKLQRVSGGAFSATEAAGNARLTIAGTSGAGTFSSSSLEQSNVDISTEFTNLIKAQQVYTANSKVVTTDNSLLQVTINMIQ